MYVTRHSNITDRRTLDSLWALYEVAYEPLAAVDITREQLFRHEFDEVLADPSYRITVVRDDADRPIAMAAVATDIAVTRYLSVPYFRRRYPDRLAEGRIHYIMWIVVHPDHQATRAAWELARAGLSPEAAEGALLVFDLPESNQPSERGAGAEFFFRAAKTVDEVELESFGVSRYYALDFAPQRSDEPSPTVTAEEAVVAAEASTADTPA